MSVCASHIWNLETHNSRLNKEAIIEVIAQDGCDEFFHGCRLALDPMITFGLKQMRRKKMKMALALIGIVLLLSLSVYAIVH